MPKEAARAFGPPLMSNYKGFPRGQAIAGLDESRSDASRVACATVPKERSERQECGLRNYNRSSCSVRAADPDERRTPGLHSLGENTERCLLDMIELSRRGSNP